MRFRSVDGKRIFRASNGQGSPRGPVWGSGGVSGLGSRVSGLGSGGVSGPVVTCATTAGRRWRRPQVAQHRSTAGGAGGAGRWWRRWRRPQVAQHRRPQVAQAAGGAGAQHRSTAAPQHRRWRSTAAPQAAGGAAPQVAQALAATCVSTWESVLRGRNRFLVGADRSRRSLRCPRRDRAVDRSPGSRRRPHRRGPIPATPCSAACYAFPSHNHCYVN